MEGMTSADGGAEADFKEKRPAAQLTVFSTTNEWAQQDSNLRLPPCE
jgi:hypothetical protein